MTKFVQLCVSLMIMCILRIYKLVLEALTIFTGSEMVSFQSIT